MSQNLCVCHCGTRISVDEQLLEEREMWREKYNCLQRQATNDLGKLKENMYIECAAIMQKEFSTKEAELTLLGNQKNAEIKSLTARVITLQANLKVQAKENEILTAKTRELEEALAEREGTLQTLRSRGTKNDRDWEARLEEELTALRRRLAEQYQGEAKQRDVENEHLRHCVRQLQKRFQAITPQVEKLKQALSAKNEQVEQLQAKLERTKREAETQLLRAKQETQEVEKAHANCRNRITKLELQTESLSGQLQAAKRVKREVRVEPVYIERPVQVEKIVEKVVQVQKVVNKYIEPTTFPDEHLEAELKAVKEENARLLSQITSAEELHILRVRDYEEALRQYEENEGKYKKEREELARRLQEQEREIDTIHAFIERRRVEGGVRSNEPEKITIHVTKDGKYQKTVERVSSTNPNPYPTTTTNTNIKAPRRK